MSGKRIAIIGASSGLGRCIALGLTERGNTTALLARRKERLVEASEEAAAVGGTAVPIVCDVTDEAMCHAAVTEAAEALGGLDALVYTTAVFPIVPLVETDARLWTDLFATNVIGAATATTAALPYLRESAGTAVYLSSVSASSTPWPYIGGYVTSKSALNTMVEAWRVEHPELGFTTLTVGECAGGEGHSQTESHLGAKPETLRAAYKVWATRGHITGNLIEPEHLVDTVTAVLQIGGSGALPRVTLASRAKAPA